MYALGYWAMVGEDTLQVVVKSKPTDIEVCNMINKIAQGCGLDLAIVYERYKTKTGFRYVYNKLCCIIIIFIDVSKLPLV